jgi:predicted  nucleic acid-binding Zn-ribbon protein
MADTTGSSRPSTAHGPDTSALAAEAAASPTGDSSTLAHTEDGHDDAGAEEAEVEAGEAEEEKEQHTADDDRDVREWDIPDDELPPLPSDDADEDLSLVDPTTTTTHFLRDDTEDASALLERDTRRKLMDVESSFLPEPDTEPAEVERRAQGAGADDTYLFGGSPGHSKRKEVGAGAAKGRHQRNKKSIADIIRESIKEEEKLRSPTSPESTRKLGEGDEDDEDLQSRESTTTIPPSSPAAEAAQRSKAKSMAHKAEVESATDESSIIAQEESPPKRGHERQISQASTIRAEDVSSSNDESLSFADVTTTPRSEKEKDDAVSLLSSTSSRLLKRPSFLSHRQSSQRSSASSYTGRSVTSEGSESTIGADFTLHSGGAMPSTGNSYPNLLAARLPSYGSISSAGESVNGDAPSISTRKGRELSRLDEEKLQSPPETPRPSTSGNSAPTDTVIAQHVQNIRVPETIAREYREKHAARSPNRLDSTGPLASFRESRKSNLTLKEQNSKIDKLTKENFDLKLKIHFLDQALQNRSDEGVKDMIGKNVQLQTDLANEKKESQSLRKKIKELEQKLKAADEARSKPPHRPSSAQSDRTEKLADLEEEVIFLRETVQEHEVEIERLREEALAKEVEKRKLADYVKVMSEESRRSASAEDAGVEETIDMWKDLLQAETARREQADEDAEKLREEVRRLKEAGVGRTDVRNVYNINKRHQTVSNSYGARSEAGGSTAGADMANGDRSDSAASTLVDQLKHENAELRRDLSAQTSMLTSRNRERERLQQEIEDLKLNQRRHAGDLSAVRSIAGDSIFERSVSRAHNRAESRMSGNTRMTQLSDAERDDFERRHATLRDELAQVKMINQDLERELNAHLDILQNVEAENKAMKEDKDLTLEDLNALQSERDEAVALVETLEEEAEDLRKEALAEIEALENELNQKMDDFEALQQEMKTVSETVVRLEDELTASRRKEEQLESQLEETEAELDRTAEKLRDTQNKNERLDVQLESSQTEIAFLREEQEADKIKIGELEASLSASQTSLQDERERIAEERRQREIVDGEEKAEVQKVLDELNEEVGRGKEEGKRLRKNLERKEEEARSWKERLETLEANLKEALGDLSGTRSSILKVCCFHHDKCHG